MQKEIGGTTGLRGMTVFGNPADPYFQNIDAITETFNPLMTWARTCLRPGATMIDVGGNIGVSSLLLARAFPDSQIHTFEPHPENFGFLLRNLEANGVRNCRAVHAAAGREAGYVYMAGSGSSSRVGSAAPAGGSGADRVPVLTLDGYVAQQGLGPVDFIKIDVEGFEPAVLEGAAGIIERHRPPILMEFNTWCLDFMQGFDAHSFASQLWAAFEVASLDPGGTPSAAGGGDVFRFLHDNVVLHGTVEDVLLRLKPGATVPKVAALTQIARASDHSPELQWLRGALDAVHRSTSWRVTAPLRALGRIALGLGLGQR